MFPPTAKAGTGRAKPFRVSNPTGEAVATPSMATATRYSVAGAAKRFGVKLDTVRAWIKRGLVKGERTDFEASRRASATC